MNIKDDFNPYMDGNGLMAPRPYDPNTGKVGSDNGPMYTGEFYVILAKLDLIRDYDIATFRAKIGQCISPNGMLNRVPIDQYDGQEQADDYYGVLNACIHLGITDIPRQFFKATLAYLGFLNNVEPGKKTLDSFLIRQVSLLACIIAASFPKRYNPFHILIRIFFLPSFVWAAVTIAVSAFHTPTNNTDSRRLSWHVLQITSRVSILCKLASLIWYHRLANDYGPTGMQAVAAIYYNPKGDNPYSKYWVTI